MLGNSGAGKTTYVSLMYAAMHEGVCGFRVRASDDAHHRQLVADAKAIRAGAYPAATHRRACYDLALSYNGSEVMPFSWRDHRGGAASGRTSDARDVAELNQDLLDSDAIVMFVDGAELVNDPRAAAQMVGRLSSHILRALHSREEFLTPVVIAITKCDLIDLGDARVRGALDAPLRELVGAVRASCHVQGTVVQISCGPSPQNVILPVLFTLRFGVIGMGMRLAAAAQYFSEAARAAAGRDTLRDRIIARRRAQSSGSLAVQLRLNAERAYQDLLVLIPPAEGLDKLLRDVESF